MSKTQAHQPRKAIKRETLCFYVIWVDANVIINHRALDVVRLNHEHNGESLCLIRCVLGNTTILAEFVSEEDVARYIAHSQAGAAGSGGTTAGAASSGPAASAVGANGNGGGTGGSSVGGGVEGGSTAGGAGNGGAGHSSSGWQSLESTGSTSDQSITQGPGLGVFAQWSNGTGVGGAGGLEAGRQGLWGGMGGMSGAGYPSSSLWGSQALEDRHQMGSPASLLPGDLLGGGADSI